MHVTLAKGRTFRSRERVFRYGEPVEVRDAQEFVYLTHSGYFVESPPLSLPVFEFHGPSPRVDVPGPFGGRVSFRPGEHRRVSHFVAGRLRGASGLREVKVAELLRKKPDGRVLVARNMGLGDVLIVTAVLRELKRQFPRARIVFATIPRYLPLLEGNPDIHSAVAIGAEPGAVGFDASVDLCNWSETALDRCTRPRADVFGCKLGLGRIADRRPVYRVRPDERRWARRVLEHLPRPVVGIGLRASTRVRTYPLESSRRLARLLVATGASVVLLDHAAATGWAGPQILNLSGRTTIRQAGAIIECLDALVAPDSGLIHLAAAAGTPTVALFGSIPHQLRIAGYPQCRAIQINEHIGCPPCFDAGCVDVTCLRRISPAQILAVLTLVLSEVRGEEVSVNG